MEQAFLALVEQLNTDPRQYCQKTYLYIRDRVESKDALKAFYDVLSEDIKKNDSPIIKALCLYVKSSITYYSDVLSSTLEIDEAILELEKIEDYKKLDLYYSLLGSKAIFLNVLGKYSESYHVTATAIHELSASSNISALCIFYINMAYIFNELEYPEEALSILENYKENRSYLSNFTKIHLARVFLSTYKLVGDYDSYLAEIAVLKEYNVGNFLTNSYLLNYFIAQHDMINACKLKDMLENNIPKDEMTPANHPDTVLAIARYYYFLSDYENSYKYYSMIYEYINIYAGEKIEIIHEYIKLLYRLNKHIEAFEAYEKLHEEYEYHRKMTLAIFREYATVDYATLKKNYNTTMLKLDMVTSFYNEAVKCEDFTKLVNDYYTLTYTFFPGTKILPLFKKKDGLYALKDNEISKVLPSNKLDIFNLKRVSHVIPILLPFDGYSYVYTVRIEDSILGYILMDEKFMNMQDDSTKGLCVDVAHSLFKAYYNLDNIQKLKELSNIDSLTKAYNRQGLDLFLKNLEYKDTYFIELDIDSFKSVNDTYGHPAGDEVLKKLVQTLSKFFRKNQIFRLGGEEFAIISSETKDEITYKFNAIRDILKNNPVLYKDSIINITISYGGTHINNYKDFKKAYERADKYLYEVKKSGKNNGYLE